MRVVVALVVVVGVGAAGCDDCRSVEPRILALECEVAESFRGELHLDSAATWRSFLSDRCLPTSDVAAIDGFVGQVDFAVDAVIVARGPRLSTTRCLVSREVESLDTCTDGLRIVFDDEELGPEACTTTPDWTVAVVVPRGELRAALADDVSTVDEDSATLE